MRFVPRHEVTRALAKAIRPNVIATGDEGPLHKAWALVPSSLVEEHHVYTPGVAYHAWVVTMLVPHIGDMS